jgi:hypothetical protein
VVEQGRAYFSAERIVVPSARLPTSASDNPDQVGGHTVSRRVQFACRNLLPNREQSLGPEPGAAGQLQHLLEWPHLLKQVEARNRFGWDRFIIFVRSCAVIRDLLLQMRCRSSSCSRSSLIGRWQRADGGGVAAQRVHLYHDGRHTHIRPRLVTFAQFPESRLARPDRDPLRTFPPHPPVALDHGELLVRRGRVVAHQPARPKVHAPKVDALRVRQPRQAKVAAVAVNVPAGFRPDAKRPYWGTSNYEMVHVAMVV